ncbi:MAG: glucokinase [Gammaproteobacteria bacterium]
MSAAAPRPNLLVDIGGTNARFAPVAHDGGVGEPTVLKTADFASFESALEHFLTLGPAVSGELHAMAVAAAGPVLDDRIELTNCSWSLELDRLRALTATGAALLINDFEAIAWALPALGRADLRVAGGAAELPRMHDNARFAVVGPGTGLGVGAFVPDARAGHVAIAAEGGHVNLAALDDREWALLSCIKKRLGHVSTENALSGPGLENIYRALGELEPDDAPEGPGAEDIARRAHSRGCTRSAAALRQFTAWLGDCAGDAALTYGALDGVFIAGGIVPSWGEAFDDALFRERFECKGRMQAYMQRIPTWIITEPHPGLTGLLGALRARGL